MHKFTIVLILIFSMLFVALAYNKSTNKPVNQIQQEVAEDQFMGVNETLIQLEKREDLKTATFAGGCFWCMEGPFEQMEGVEEVISGYTGGEVENPSYEQVLTDTTGHKESVKIFYDPNVVSFEELLEIYWYQIDPTDSGGQFADRGEQYKTAIYYQTDEEKQIAEESKSTLDASGKYEKPIVTEILPAQKFYPAEDYHQDFYKDSAEKYKRYKKASGREDYIEENSPEYNK